MTLPELRPDTETWRDLEHSQSLLLLLLLLFSRGTHSLRSATDLRRKRVRVDNAARDSATMPPDFERGPRSVDGQWRVVEWGMQRASERAGQRCSCFAISAHCTSS